MKKKKLNLYCRPTNTYIIHYLWPRVVIFYQYCCECTLMKFAIET